ncbi:MAG: cyclic nucleotide-binding domain-containing protein [Spirochaetota bacterium]
MKEKKDIISFSVYAHSKDIIRAVLKSARNAQEQEKPFRPEIHRELYKAIDYLTYGQTNSRLFFLEYRADEEFSRVIEKIRNDPWLHGTVIIVLASNLSKFETDSLFRLGVADIIFIHEILHKLPTVASIITANLSLFESQQFLSENTAHKKGRIILKNDTTLVPKVTNALMEFCYAAGFRNLQSYTRIALCLHEMISNAIEHGNCAIGYEKKSKYLQDNLNLTQVVKDLAKAEEIRNKKVCVHYDINGTKAIFRIVDEGKGFREAELPDPSSENNMLVAHGRGIMMTRNFVDRMEYNGIGNEVTLEFSNTAEIRFGNNELMKLGTETAIHLSRGDVLFEAGSESDYFYYITSGRLGIYLKGKKIAESTPEDIFVGEMAFLHHNKRTGTVKALAPSTLIPISRNGFIQMVKKYPYAGVFLARLLTKRLIKRDNAD